MSPKTMGKRPPIEAISKKPSLEAVRDCLKSFIRAVNDYELDGDLRSPEEAEVLEELHDQGLALLIRLRKMEVGRKAQASAEVEL